MTAAIEVRRLDKRFAGLVVLSDVNLRVEAGSRHAVIGPNGAGKTTLFNVIAGQLAPTRGQVFYFGEDVTALPPEARARRGLGRTFQRNNLFFELTARENVQLAVLVHRGLCRQWFRPVHADRETAARTEEILAMVGLEDVAGQRAADLSYGYQRQLEIGVALATEPRVLLLDEPTAGMSPAETQRMTALIRSLPPDTTVLIIEHDMDVVAALADRISVLHLGRVLVDGPADQVRGDPEVASVYLGLNGEGETGPAAG